MQESRSISELWADFQQSLANGEGLQEWTNLIDPNLRWLHNGCREAIRNAEQIHDDTIDEAILQWEAWLRNRSSLSFVVPDSDFPSRRGLQRNAALLLLLCTKVLRRHAAWTTASISPTATPDLFEAADQIGLPRNLVLDLAGELLTDRVRDAPECRAALLSVDERRGQVMFLTVRRVEKGSGELYPVPAMSFVPRNVAFDQALDNATSYVKNKMGLWPPKVDVSWDLIGTDDFRRPLGLRGDSGGLAFALAIAKVLVTEEIPARG